MNQLAPIGISTYKRLAHLKETVNALRKNHLAEQSDLYIFSDFPKKGDEESVNNVRKYIHSIDGFKKVECIERTNNDRVFNGRNGIKFLLDKYEKCLFLEEDIVTAPGFLKFMNDALIFYRNDARILSLSGYRPPYKLYSKFDKDVFLLQRFCAWGFGTWKHKFDPFNFDVQQHNVQSFLKDRRAIKNIKKNGNDIYKMLLKEVKGELDALDVKLMFYEFKYNKFTLYPRESLVQNIGHDGTGIHCGVNTKFNHEKLWGKKDCFTFEKGIILDQKIVRINRRFRNPNVLKKFSILINRIKNFVR